MDNVYIIGDKDYLMHHGIKGQKWGERRFQNPDGTLTPEGKARYQKYVNEFGEKTAKRLMKSQNKGLSEKEALQKEYNKRKNYNLKKTAINALAGSAGAVGGYIGGRAIGNALTYSPKNMLTEHKLVDKIPLNEFLSKYGNGPIPGAKGFYYLYNTTSKPIRNYKNVMSFAGSALTGALTTYGANKIQKVNSGYSKYDTSAEGLSEFYNKMKKINGE